jgi:hypothetical protein
MDAIKATGDFILKVINITGEIQETYEAKNLVVELGKTNVAQLIGGHADGLKLTHIAAGENDSQPALDDAAITNPFIKPFDSVTYPDATSVSVHWTLDNNEANGMSLREFGLLTQNNKLFARKVRTEIQKTNQIRLAGTWTININ